MTKGFIPVSVKEMKLLGWDQPDVILISGDAYVDHPSFANAVIARFLQSLGLNVVIVPQPNWKDDLRDFRKFGTPKLFFAVSAGNMDSMVNHYTAGRRRRSDDAYTPGGKAGFRPDYPSQVYTSILKDLYPDVPVILGGIEASLRRLTHFDYWQDELRPGILNWTGADLLIYGMGEQPLEEIVRLLLKGVPFSSLKTVPQTAFLQPVDENLPTVKKWSNTELHSHEECLTNKSKYAENFRHIEQESNRFNAARLHQKCGDERVVVNPPYPPMDEALMDGVFNLPFTRIPHPKYNGKGTIPAYEMIKHSITMHRGCFGGCSFCTISAHQGKFISSRSENSILKEVKQVSEMEDFKGYISDLGGPSANMYKMAGKDINICSKCIRPSCIFPNICTNLNTNHNPLVSIYQKADKIEGIKKTFIGSGVRYDMFLNPKADENEKKSHQNYMQELITNHVSGRLKVAPEHTSDHVLKLMRKPSFTLFKEFNRQFNAINKSKGLNQQLIPYFISSHPGSTESSMAELASETKALNFNLEQVQDFTPTPMTLATVIYYSGINPYTMKPVFTAKTRDEKETQRMFFFWYKPEFRKKITALLRKNNLTKIEKLLFYKEGKDKSKPFHSNEGVKSSSKKQKSRRNRS
ncbi:YgiQ family radical SAM protein [Natronoflexus pectinivorans]|uniref:Putative radical SAM protein YgiQ n=1 Tax=Natronoflexus pectinivorans TaxID=682526 RepID=A0A4V2RWM0_9BACT|nr:YgiQ family radical SAM protein [Natronoflexus pectinivorans]TCO09120.1 putative radical SAM protein YgiQ [Natronoflexus pectinivorans]